MDKRDFQPIRNTIVWRVHFGAPPERVYQFLATDEGRREYWAESAEEVNGMIRWVFHNGIESTGSVLEMVPDSRVKVSYFNWLVTLDLMAAPEGGTDLIMTCERVADGEWTESVAGWVSLLLTMKAAVDFGVDLRNHDPTRTWNHGYVDN
jgi:uncharacterized protein YndB with AHSA1/START domain